jgi:chromosome segregation ATPase
MLQMLWAKLGHEGYSNLFARLRSDVAALVATLAARDGSIVDLQTERTDLQGKIVALGATLAARDTSVAGLQADIVNLKEESANQGRMLKARDASVTDLQGEVEELKEQIATLDGELVETRIALATANRKVRAGQSDTATLDEMSTSENSIVTSKQYQLVREHMQAAILRGDKINMKKVAADSGVSYNTVRRHAQPIIDDLLRQTEKLRVVHPERESA